MEFRILASPSSCGFLEKKRRGSLNSMHCAFKSRLQNSKTLIGEIQKKGSVKRKREANKEGVEDFPAFSKSLFAYALKLISLLAKQL